MLLVLGARELHDTCMLSYFLLNLAEQLDGFKVDIILIMYLVLAALTELGVHDLVSFQRAATVCNFGSNHGGFETFEVCKILAPISRQRLLGSSLFWFWFWIWVCVCVWILSSFWIFECEDGCLQLAAEIACFLHFVIGKAVLSRRMQL